MKSSGCPNCFLTLLVLACILLSPTATHGQAILKSSDFSLDTINFGSNFTLISQEISPPVISAEGPTVVDLEATKVTITWRTDRDASSFIQYGTSTDYGQETGSSSLATNHTVTIMGLTPETLYHFRATSADAFGEKALSADKTFTTPAEAGITAINISDIGYDHALVSWKTGLFTQSVIQYGPTLSYGQVAGSASRGFLTDHVVELTGLAPGTNYHLRITATDEKGTVSRSSDFSFSTIAEPQFTHIDSQVVSPNTVTINWSTNTPTNGLVTYTQTKTGAKNTTGTQDRTITHSLQLTPLIGDSDYSFTVIATDDQGKQATSPPQSFHTAVDTVPPKIDDLKIKLTRAGEVLVLTATWKTDEPSTTEGVLEAKDDPQNQSDVPPQGDFSTNHILVKTGVQPSLAYTLAAISKDPYGNKSQAAINFISPSSRKDIISLLIDSIMRPFSWLTRAFAK